MHEIEVSSVGNKVGKLSYLVLSIVAFALPFFIIPSTFYGLQISKSLLIAVGVLFSLFAFIISLIKTGELEIPKNIFTLSVFLIPLVFLISALANGGKDIMLIGEGGEMGTVVAIALCFVGFFLTSQVYRNKERVFYSYLALFASYAIVALYQVSRWIFGTDFLDFGLFTQIGNNLIGNWFDLSIFFGAVALLSLLTLEMVSLSKVLKILTYIVFVSSIVFLVLVNFSTTWLVLAAISLAVFLYEISFKKFSRSEGLAGNAVLENPNAPEKRKVSWNSLALLIVSVIFLFGGTQIGEKFVPMVGRNVEVRPSWQATYSVLKETLKGSPLLGSGPNTFNNEWIKYKPLGINQTQLWAADFNYGIGLIPTFAVTTGVLGILAWVFFFATLIRYGLAVIFKESSDLFSKYVSVSSFVVALFFWIMSVVYVTSLTNVFLAFFFTGIFASTLYKEGLIRSKLVRLSDYPKVNFVSVLFSVAILIGSITLAYWSVKEAVALSYFQRGIAVFNEKSDFEKSNMYITKAISWSNKDAYYRGMSQLGTAKLTEIVGRQDGNPEQIREEFQNTLAATINNAKKSTEVAPDNYQNWVGLAAIYAELVPAPLAISGAYESANEAYDKALALNPHSPSIILAKARLEVLHNDLNKAREYVEKAIQEKPNYTEAHFLLSQIEATLGNVHKAIPALETTLLLSPNNPGLYFQLGVLKYTNKDYLGAGQAMFAAVTLVPDYANAKYFLGLSLDKIGRRDDALAQFLDLEKTNPDNQEVKNIIANLRAGKDPFANVKPPLDNRPEKRETLPVKEAN